MSAYNLRFSNPSKTSTIVVQGVNSSTGLDNFNTSLELVGNGYPDYARAISQNFLKLLENFSSPHPPENPIEGQLWYDTSDLTRKILKVNNGILSSSRWVPVGEVFRQPTDPAIGFPSTVNDGILWADTSTGTLKIRVGSSWKTIGPAITFGNTKTGTEVAFLRNNADTDDIPVILNYANGIVVEIISATDFIPLFPISGFTSIKRGINLTTFVPAKYNGLSEKSLSLQASNGKLYFPENLLKNTTNNEQIHTGTFVVESTNGIYIKNKSANKAVQIYNNASGNFVEGNINSTLNIGLKDQIFIKFNGLYNNIGINTSTSSISPTLDVNGTGRYSGSLTIAVSSNTNGLIVNGVSNFNSTVNMSTNVTVNGTSTFVGKIVAGDSSQVLVPVLEPISNGQHYLGSPQKPFKTVHTLELKGTSSATNTLSIYGTLYGPAQSLITQRNFSVSGELSSLSFPFNGTQNVVIPSYINKDFIDNKTEVTSTNSLYFIALNSSDNYVKISSQSLLKNNVAPGSITIFPSVMESEIDSAEYLECDGSNLLPLASPTLYDLLGGDGISPVALPSISPITTGIYTLKYYIKT